MGSLLVEVLEVVLVVVVELVDVKEEELVELVELVELNDADVGLVAGCKDDCRVVSKLGNFWLSLLHNCAYIDEYLGSSKAFSNMRRITPFKRAGELRPKPISVSLSFSNLSGVILLRILE